MEKLLRPLRAGAGVAIASRGLRESQVELHQPWYRETMGKIFNRLVRIFVLGGVHDTQCGFKAFTAEVADRVFPELQTRGFGFDVEVLYRAQQAGYRIVEVRPAGSTRRRAGSTRSGTRPRCSSSCWRSRDACARIRPRPPTPTSVALPPSRILM